MPPDERNPMLLSVTQREAIRALAQDPHAKVSERTLASLIKRGLVDADTGELTRLGKRTHTSIMRSGDGPESLKELFRFGSQ